MQVGIKSGVSHSLTPSSLNRKGVSATQSVVQSRQTKEAQRNAFPESPLLSTQPTRYNIQLNYQLTAVQQADNFLNQVENGLLKLQHTVSTSNPKENAVTLVKNQAQDLSNLLAKREKLSAGTIDRQMNVVLDSNSKVYFTLRGVDGFFQHSESEMLVFSLAGQQRDIAAVKIDEDSSPAQVMRALNIGLGKFNIHGQFDDNQQPIFSVAEKQWSRVSEHLSVRGEGYRYPEGQFFPVKVVAEPALEQVVDDLVAKPAQAKQKMSDLQKSLEQVTLQRRQLTRHKESIQQRINGMAGFAEQGSAIEASQLLKATFMGANNDYATLTQVTAAQANLTLHTVKNLLG